jgi:hypothetical protein
MAPSNRKAGAEEWAFGGGFGWKWGCFGSQNRINFTKFDHDFWKGLLIAKGLSSICTKNGAGIFFFYLFL